eukprot:6459140-Amphidinium_carterae.1
MAAQCPNQGASSTGEKGGKNYFQHGFVDDEHSQYFVDYMVVAKGSAPPMLGVIDTGAVNAVVGANTLAAVDTTLQSYHLGIKRIPPPTRVGGIGGACQVVMAVEIPISLGKTCGTVSAVVVPGEIPFLVPLPLLKSQGALMDLEKGIVHWRNGSTSALLMLPSGHAAVTLSDDLSKFHCSVPNAHEFTRGSAHEQVRQTLQASLSQYHTSVALGDSSVPGSLQTSVALGDSSVPGSQQTSVALGDSSVPGSQHSAVAHGDGSVPGSLAETPSSRLQLLRLPQVRSLALRTDGSGSANHRTTSSHPEEDQRVGRHRDCVRQGLCRLMETPCAEGNDGSPSGGLHRHHCGVAGSGHQASCECHGGNQLIESRCGHQSTDAGQASLEECSTRRHCQVPAETGRLSTSGGALQRISSRLLVDVQNVSSSLATRAAGVPTDGGASVALETTACLVSLGMNELSDDDEQADNDCKDAVHAAHSNYLVRFESSDHLSDVLKSKSVGRVVGFDALGNAGEVWLSDCHGETETEP